MLETEALGVLLTFSWQFMQRDSICSTTLSLSSSPPLTTPFAVVLDGASWSAFCPMDSKKPEDDTVVEAGLSLTSDIAIRECSVSYGVLQIVRIFFLIEFCSFATLTKILEGQLEELSNYGGVVT
jgi:hypothetical protein